MTRTNTSDEEGGWERGWDGHELGQRRRLAEAPLADKLRWLEEAHRLVRHLTSATPRGEYPDNAPRPAGEP